MGCKAVHLVTGSERPDPHMPAAFVEATCPGDAQDDPLRLGVTAEDPTVSALYRDVLGNLHDGGQIVEVSFRDGLHGFLYCS